jgi:hypothetical protein
MVLSMAAGARSSRAAFGLATAAVVYAALTVAWLLVAFAVITGFSIGMFVLPGALMLVAAAALTPVARS